MFRRLFPKNPEFVGDMISAKICQKIIILSAIWFRRKSEEGSDACNIDCGNRVDSKQRSVTAWSTVQTEFCRYKWLIRPLIHRNAIASLDWIGKIGSSPPANVKRFPANVNRFESKKFYICSDVTHTHTHPACSGVWFFGWATQQKLARLFKYKNLFPVLMYRAVFNHSEGRCVPAWSVWIASRKLMSSSILHVSLSSPDAIAALKVMESCWARSWIFGVKWVCLRRCRGLNGNIVIRVMSMY